MKEKSSVYLTYTLFIFKIYSGIPGQFVANA